MSTLLAVLNKINDIEASISRMAAEATPESAYADRLALQSLEDRRDQFRDELAQMTRQEFVEICDYRIISNVQGTYALSGVANVLHEFQNIFSIVYDAITSRPKQKFDLPADIMEKTRFNFGFAYSGSLGVALTIPNERLLAIGTPIDEAIKIVFSLLESDSSDSLKKAEILYGPPAIKKLYVWSKLHRDYGLSADIKWIRDKEVRNSVIAQTEKFNQLCGMIESRSDDKTEQMKISGVLTMWNTTGRRFTLEVPDAEPISGHFSKGFDANTPRTVRGTQYEATLLKHTKIIYTSEKDEVNWELISLRTLL